MQENHKKQNKTYTKDGLEGANQEDIIEARKQEKKVKKANGKKYTSFDVFPKK
jgi:hypothetical protein